MSHNPQKMAAADAAIELLLQKLIEGMAPFIGVGTGSTVNCLFERPQLWSKLRGAVASSEATLEQLKKLNVPIVTLEQCAPLPVYVDGADEIDPSRALIKGGGGALTQEKMLAAASSEFWCIVDSGKRVEQLGRFPLPVEVIPAAKGWVAHQLKGLGATNVSPRAQPSDNGNPILDAYGLGIDDPDQLEREIESWPGVVCCGVFARHRPHRVFCASSEGVVIWPS